MSATGTVRLAFLGGVGEIGKNMCMLEAGGKILVIDAGAKFPENDMLGVDLVIPDYGCLETRKQDIVGLILTHGHEDHVGGLPFFLRRVTPPTIHATPLTLGIIQAKLEEYDDLTIPPTVEVKAGDRVELGPFGVEFLHVNHSIPDAVGLAIRTPAGTIIHTADFKIDQTPIDGRVLDVGAFARYGQEGVRLLICDSTNAEKPGYVVSETLVGETFRRVLENAPGRVVFAMFASNIHRLQQVFDQAERLGRRVVVDGRSMIKNADVATRLGHLRYPTGLRISADDMADHEPDELVIVTTGSQGEPMSALTRMSVGEHRQIPIEEGDTVVLSATPIPGNEAAIWRTVNNLFRLGAVVVYSAVDMVHVSGHGNQEELKLMLSLTRPEHVVPYHGEPRHQYIYKQLAVQAEVKPENVHLLQPYDVLEISERGVRLVDRLPGEPMLVDGAGVGDVGASVLRERRALSEDGVVFVSAVIDTSSREILDGPAIESRGFVYVDESEDLIDGALDVATDAILGADTDTQTDEVERELKSSVSRYFRSHTGRRPLIIPMLFEVDAAAPLDDQGEEPQ